MNKLFYVLIISAIVLVSCEKKFVYVCSTYNLNEFNIVALNDVFHVYLYNDTLSYVEIRGSKEIIENVTYSIQDSVLMFNNNSN
ncbi:MAG: hypothetical protein JEZ09_18910 [Salinivirgaceae bacterium]|nr:hypothetical protein [Salinivirgaceae bacterium]